MRTSLLILILLFIFNSSAFSKPGTKHNMSLDQAVERVKRENGGRVLSARTQREMGSRGTHNVRVLTPNGKVKRYRINEANGQYIRPQRR